MAAIDFGKHPYKYVKGHVVTFSHAAQDTKADHCGMQEIRRVKRQGWDAIEYDITNGSFTSFTFIGDSKPNWDTKTNEHVRIGKKGFHQVACTTTAIDLGIRFLPWAQDAITYMRLDSAAKTFFTGPLSGCSIYIVEDTITKQLWAFHANRNNAGNIPNAAMKHSMMATACFSDLNIAGRVRHEAIYKKHYMDNGFVFGEKSGSGWKFWAGDTIFINPGAKPTGGYATSTHQTILKELPRS